MPKFHQASSSDSVRKLLLQAGKLCNIFGKRTRPIVFAGLAFANDDCFVVFGIDYLIATCGTPSAKTSLGGSHDLMRCNTFIWRDSDPRVQRAFRAGGSVHDHW